MNPDAPDVIQVGKAERVAKKAVLLSTQPDTVFPVFVKQNRTDRTYQFVGNYKYKAISTNPTTIASEELKSGRKNELASILYLQSA
jgi:hypothetical protein